MALFTVQQKNHFVSDKDLANPGIFKTVLILFNEIVVLFIKQEILGIIWFFSFSNMDKIQDFSKSSINVLRSKQFRQLKNSLKLEDVGFRARIKPSTTNRNP